jgi:uncharacterized membrane protein YheB (UPF0754 family)
MAEPKNYGRLVTGELLTEELIEKLSKEAEEGWEVEELLRWDAEAKAAAAADAPARSARPRHPRRRR